MRTESTLDEPIGVELERRRLALSERRLELVIERLRERADDHTRTRGGPPAPLREALVSFDQQLEDVRRRQGRLGRR